MNRKFSIGLFAALLCGAVGLATPGSAQLLGGSAGVGGAVGGSLGTGTSGGADIGVGAGVGVGTDIRGGANTGQVGVGTGARGGANVGIQGSTRGSAGVSGQGGSRVSANALAGLTGRTVMGADGFVLGTIYATHRASGTAYLRSSIDGRAVSIPASSLSTNARGQVFASNMTRASLR